MRAILLAATVAAVSSQNVRVTWIGQACFYIQTENGPTVVVDPPAASQGYAFPATAADAVFVSHNHGDHNNVAGVRGTPSLVDGRPTTTRTEMNAAGLPFLLIPGFHDAAANSTNRNTIVQWTQGGLRFAHFGDYGQSSLSAEQIADLQNLDVLMVPAGGFFTLAPALIASTVVELLKPRVTILMHFRTGLGGPAQLPFSPDVGAPFSNVRFKPSSVTLSRANLPSSGEVWIMEPAAEAAAVNAAGFAAGAPVAPGAIASAFGPFTGSATAGATDVPLPLRLGETEVFIGNTALPLFYASPDQINFQVPSTLTPGQRVFEVRVGGQRVARGTLTTAARAPGLYLAVDTEGRVGRVRRGRALVIYANGQGAVTPAVADGTPAPPSPLSSTSTPPAVFLGGRSIPVPFSGLAPGFVGLWQINVDIPADFPAGPTEIVVLYDSSLVSNALSIAVD